MTYVLELKPEVEARVREAAQRRGVSEIKIVEEAVETVTALSAGERAVALLDALLETAENEPPHPDGDAIRQRFDGSLAANSERAISELLAEESERKSGNKHHEK